jgi:hypothetical protein
MSIAVDSERIKTINVFLSEGKAAIANKSFQSASDKCSEGIKLLGSDYFSSDVIDDTGSKLILAKSAEEKGNFDFAANMYCKILQSRLDLIKQKTER